MPKSRRADCGIRDAATIRRLDGLSKPYFWDDGRLDDQRTEVEEKAHKDHDIMNAIFDVIGVAPRKAGTAEPQLEPTGSAAAPSS